MLEFTKEKITKYARYIGSSNESIYIARIKPRITFQNDEKSVITVVKVVWKISLELSPIADWNQFVTISQEIVIDSGSNGIFRVIIHSRIVEVRSSIYLGAFSINP